MSTVRRAVGLCVVLLLCNAVFLWNMLDAPLPVKLGALFVVLALYLGLSLRPRRGGDLPKKLARLGGGCDLMLVAAVCAVAELAVVVWFWQFSGRAFSTPVWIGSIAVSLAVLAATVTNGAIRVLAASGQVTVTSRVALVLLLWVPGVNVVLFIRIYGTASREYRFGLLRLERNRTRRADRVCATAYPILLVHGIFFRDWKHFNYWGRIPAELEENGAVIHYGGQQSSASVEQSAGELRDRILAIVEKEGCEKVNIIAHSKGGLDARYAISCLGMDKYVASLTTVNTPHRGCRFAKKALDNLPQEVVSAISKSYDAIFAKLGDDQPDFFTGVSDLTDETCRTLNEKMPDRAGVLYRSIGSKMASASSAGFPLNLGYGVVSAVDGENDGLVHVDSMPWGAFTMLEPTGKRGISHGDVIDLTRKDIAGFDVCEFYVEQVSALKKMGL